MKNSLFTPVVALAMFACPQLAKSQSVEDYWAFGVNGGTLYGFTSETNRTPISTLLTGDPATYTANHLATDVGRNRVIYSLPTIAFPGTMSAIYAWDFGTNSRVDITNGSDIAGMIGSSSGGGSFYNGDYYLWDDDGTSQGIVKMSFDTGGLIDTLSKPWGNISTIGPLGDIAIDASGMMYMLNSANRLYHMDLNDPLSSPIFMGDYTGYATNGQLFIDDEGRLLTRQSGSGNWINLDPNGPGVLGIITGPAAFDAYGDLAEGAVVGIVIPEPSTSLFAGLAATLVFFRRRQVA